MSHKHDWATFIVLKPLPSAHAESSMGNRSSRDGGNGENTDIILPLVSEQLEQLACIAANPMRGRIPDD